jgi:hypothetical protein
MRRTPYTEIGIKRVKCFRFATCGNKAEFQWTICSDGNVFRPICKACDIALNETVLKFMGFKDWQEKLTAYKISKSVE